MVKVRDRRSCRINQLSMEEFIEQRPYPRSQMIQDPEWIRLYCRWGPRSVRVQYRDQEVRVSLDNCIVLSNLLARFPGTGAFRRLLARIQAATDAPIYAECVQNDLFACGLQKMGFEQVDDSSCVPNYLLYSHEKIHLTGHGGHGIE